MSSYPIQRSYHHWRGESGQWYTFGIFGLHENFDFDGIVYLFGRARTDGLYDPLYCGQSSQGDVRLSRHEKMAPARRLGATQVHVHFVENRAERFRIETDIRRAHKPQLNEQSMPALTLADLARLPGSGSGFGSLAPQPSLSNSLLALALAPSPPPSSNALRDLIDALDARSPLEGALSGRRW